jgi:hypothetical protein
VDQLKDFLQPAIDRLPEQWREHWPFIAAAAGLLALWLVWVVFERLLLRPWRQRRPGETEAHLREDLAVLGPPPGEPGSRRLLVDGVPARLRLVVVAPTGHEALDADPLADIGVFLERLLPGLGAVAAADKPVVRKWPAQLSKAGFAPKFQQLVQMPDAPGQASRWVVLAGPARASLRQFLLGLALYADGPTHLGRRVIPEDRWTWSLRVQEVPKG